MSGSRAAARAASSGGRIGSRPAAASAASSCPIRAIGNIIYSNNEGYITRYDKAKEQYQDISVWPLDNSGHGAEDLKHRFQWISPLFLSPHDPDTIYTAGEAVFKSTDQGQSWTAISEDLTRNDKSKQKPSGGPIHERHHQRRILRHHLRARRVAFEKRHALGRDG